MSTAARPREFTGKHMLASIVAFFGVIITVNLTMAYFANSTWSGLIVKNGYVASQSFDKDLARVRAQDALGWAVAVTHGNGEVTLRFADRDQLKLDGLSVTGQLRRPSTASLDQTLAFGAKGSGLYAAPADLKPGVWELEIVADGKSGEPFKKTYRFVVKG